MELFERVSDEPILRPQDVPSSLPELNVVGVFNPGATVDANGDIILLLRVAEAAVPQEGWVRVPVVEHDGDRARIAIKQWRVDELRDCDLSDSRHFIVDGVRYLSSLSHFRVARSSDGIHFAVDEKPLVLPEAPTEHYGIEDPRITHLEGRYYITCTAVFEDGFGVSLMSTRDFETVTRHGFLFPPENKNCVVLPERCSGKVVAFHRPIVRDFGRPCVWYAESPDGLHFGNSSCLLRPQGPWQERKIGSGPPPILTDDGWLFLYHGVDGQEAYRLFLALLDRDDPRKVVANITEPVFEPRRAWEKEGFVPNVVFSNGWVRRGDDVLMYYGGADTCVGAATAAIPDLIDALKRRG